MLNISLLFVDIAMHMSGGKLHIIRYHIYSISTSDTYLPSYSEVSSKTPIGLDWRLLPWIGPGWPCPLGRLTVSLSVFEKGGRGFVGHRTPGKDVADLLRKLVLVFRRTCVIISA